MNKLIKEILVNKAARNDSTLIALAIVAVSAGIPWFEA